MNEFYDIMNLGTEGSNFLANKYQKEKLIKLLSELNQIEEANTKELENLLLNEKYESEKVKLDIALQNGEKLLNLKIVIGEAINKHEQSKIFQKNSLVLIPEKKMNISIPEHIFIQKQDLKPLQEEIVLGTRINTDKQFLYNFKQENMEITNEVSFEVEMLFETFAAIPLRLQNKSHALNQEISFEIGFSL